MENRLDLAALFVKYLESRCTPEEIKRLLKHFENAENEQSLRELIQTELEFSEKDKSNHTNIDAAVSKIRTSLIKNIRQNRIETPVKRIRFYKWAKICAIWFLIVGIAGLLMYHYQAEIRNFIHPIKLYTINTKHINLCYDFSFTQY